MKVEMNKVTGNSVPRQNKSQRAVFVQKFVPHYRLPLFEELRAQCLENNLDFVLIYGEPDPYEGSKIKMAYPDWGVKVNSKIFGLPGKFTRYLYWQGVPFRIKKGDIVIVEHASKLLDNYVLFALQQIGWISLCYFGHGRNFQSQREIAVAKKLKELMVRRISVWFAYTKIAKKVLLDQRVPEEKIVVVNNTLKVTTTLSEADVDRNFRQYVYIGGLYAEKRLDLVLEVMDRIHKTHTDIKLLIAGTGPDQNRVEDFAEKHEWCEYLGPLYGEDRDRILFESNAILMPGPVGLVAIDSFHYATPVLTTGCHNHGPEVAYLENDVNALMLKDFGDVDSYELLVRRLVEDEELAERLREGCRQSADKYTIEDTAKRFLHGILNLQCRLR